MRGFVFSQVRSGFLGRSGFDGGSPLLSQPGHVAFLGHNGAIKGGIEHAAGAPGDPSAGAGIAFGDLEAGVPEHGLDVGRGGSSP